MSTLALPVAPPLQPAGLPVLKETEVGNYFVANYPPFGFWKPDQVPTFVEALHQPPAPGVELGLYTHIPFCRKRCHFCYFRVYTDKNSTDIRSYIDAVLTELAMYVQTPAVVGRRPTFLYFGGGTPSYLSVEQWKVLSDGMKKLISWDEAREITMEAEPGTLNDTKLRGMRELGVTRLSLGIEHFDDHILEINGRAHRSKEIARAYGYAREIGFPEINIDLIAGMVEETDEKWADTVAKAVALAPDAVTIYQMEVPYNTTIYKQMKAEGKLVAPVADWATKRRWVDYAFGEFVKAGYHVASTTTVVRDTRKTYAYRTGLFNGTDILACGVSSFGYVNGVNYQNQHDFDPYIEIVRSGRLPTHRAYALSRDEQYIREFALQLKAGQVSARAFEQKFGENPYDRFEEALEIIDARGFLDPVGDRIALTRQGLLQVDRLLFEFFLPEHRVGRYA